MGPNRVCHSQRHTVAATNYLRHREPHTSTGVSTVRRPERKYLDVVMDWNCPACRTTIAHASELPRPGAVYRCHVCRLELVTDAEGGILILAPMPVDEPTSARHT